jgi:hypothetical protein
MNNVCLTSFSERINAKEKEQKAQHSAFARKSTQATWPPRLHEDVHLDGLVVCYTYFLWEGLGKAIKSRSRDNNHSYLPCLGWYQWGRYRPPVGPAQARARWEAGEREREGGSSPAGRERTLSSRSRPRWQARGGGRRAVARRCASVRREGWGESDVARFYWSTWRLK